MLLPLDSAHNCNSTMLQSGCRWMRISNLVGPRSRNMRWTTLQSSECYAPNAFWSGFVDSGGTFIVYEKIIFKMNHGNHILSHSSIFQLHFLDFSDLSLPIFGGGWHLPPPIVKGRLGRGEGPPPKPGELPGKHILKSSAFGKTKRFENLGIYPWANLGMIHLLIIYIYMYIGWIPVISALTILNEFNVQMHASRNIQPEFWVLCGSCDNHPILRRNEGVRRNCTNIDQASPVTNLSVKRICSK